MIYALIPCSKTKAAASCPAGEMYRASTLFRGAWAVATAKGQTPLIVSAQYGLLRPDEMIDPYDRTLRGAIPLRRMRWAQRVIDGLMASLCPGDSVASYLGERYAEFVLPTLRWKGFIVHEPVKGMAQGERLAWFKREGGIAS